MALYRISESNRRCHCSVGSANDQVVTMVIEYVAFPCVDYVGNRFAMMDRSLSTETVSPPFSNCKRKQFFQRRSTRNGPVYFGTSDDCTLYARTNTLRRPQFEWCIRATSTFLVPWVLVECLSCHSRRQLSAEVGNVIDCWSLYHQLTP